MQSHHSQRIRRHAGAGLLAGMLAVTAGCQDLARPAREEDHPLMRQALALDRAGNVDGAVEAYQRAIDMRPRAARAHLNIAVLYNQPPKEDFLRAIYHFERYLEMRPNADNVGQVRELVRRAQLMYGAGLAGADSNEMLSLIADQRREAAALRQQVATLHGDIATLREELAKERKDLAAAREELARRPAAAPPSTPTAEPRLPALAPNRPPATGTLRPPAPAPPRASGPMWYNPEKRFPPSPDGYTMTIPRRRGEGFTTPTGIF
jgi:tetratricopeptide (TPR) repeat protein